MNGELHQQAGDEKRPFRVLHFWNLHVSPFPILFLFHILHHVWCLYNLIYTGVSENLSFYSLHFRIHNSADNHLSL